jgi:hypothetical protein
MLEQMAKPVLLFFSFFEPTWYQTFTATMGALWSSWTISVSPFFRRTFLYGISTAVSAATPGAQVVSVSTSARISVRGGTGLSLQKVPSTVW